MNNIKYKNLLITKTIKILNKEYLNKENLEGLDMNPLHFLDEYQFIKYVHNYMQSKDGHFWHPTIINYKHYISWIYNPYGYLCIDFSKINSLSLTSIVWDKKKETKIVVDLRAQNINVVSSNLLISFLFMFSCIRNKYTEPQIIYTYKDNKNVDAWILKYENNSLIFIYYGKITNVYKLKKKNMYECSEIICIGIENSIYTKILSRLKVPVFIQREVKINPFIYHESNIRQYKFTIPDLKLETSEYSDMHTVGIPEIYYPGV